ncbi:hypothetical protein [Arenimonas sp.]|uniref:hypothetical protein n=1 Tax=Arenimonas sp. TaxID=1872635 RepID=UPI0039E219A6
MSRRWWLSLFALVLLLAGCNLRPGELAMRQAITDHVATAEDYPMQFMKSDNFRFRDLQQVPDDERDLWRVHAEFDFVYTADGKTIVAALKEKSKAEQEKAKRRADTALEKLALAAAAALSRHGTEQRFETVKIGDKDSYAGDFTLVRNEGGGWRVDDADYQ